MPTLKEVQDQIRGIKGVSMFATRHEINELPRILADDEKIETLVMGQYTGWKDQGLVVATNRRIIFVNKDVGFLKNKLSVEDFPYDKITSVQYNTGVLYGKVTIHASGNRAEVDKIAANLAREFAEYIRAKISASKEAVPSVSGAATDDPVQRLQQLKTMLDSGLISQVEYDAKRKDILSRM